MMSNMIYSENDVEYIFWLQGRDTIFIFIVLYLFYGFEINMQIHIYFLNPQNNLCII